MTKPPTDHLHNAASRALEDVRCWRLVGLRRPVGV